jgi:uncharacterized protein YndB with AHSA1/START domain
MLKKIGLGVLAVVVLFLGYVAAQPADYTVSREITINAPAEKIFPYLNSSKLADQWGPWKEVDPQAQMVFSGPDEGVGAKTSWDSSGQLGTGSATIVNAVPNQRVDIKLEYSKPMSMTQDSVYSIKPAEGGQHVVAWTVQGKNSFMGRVMCVFMDMDKMVGGMFEKGLSNLKNQVEKSG